MKKILLSVLVLAFAGIGTVNAQSWGYGPKAGISLSTANGVEGAKTRAGVVAGVFVNRWINDWFSIQTELLYSQQGFNTKIEGQTDKYRLDYIAMPIITKFYVMGGLNFEVGAQMAYRVSARQKIGPADFADMKSVSNHFNVDFVAGLSYDFPCGLILEGRYVLSTNSVNVDAGIKTGALQMLVGWQF